MAFNIYDVDGDGFISPSEMLEIFHVCYTSLSLNKKVALILFLNLKAMYKMAGTQMDLKDDDVSTPEKRTEQIFRQMDLDKDGQITLDEFIIGTRNNPSIIRLLNIF